ncbi:MAG: aldo/keto reductase [Fibrobacterota bacterium]
MMRQKSLGRCGFTVSEIGFGARWTFTTGRTLAEAQAAHDTLKAVLEGGITHIDTASSYKDSEKVLGEVLAETGHKPVIASKAWKGDEASIRKAVEEGLKNLHVNAIDIYIIHNPESTFAALPVYRKLKDEGLIRAIGVTGWHGDEERMRRVIEDGTADILQIAITMTHRGMIEKGIMGLAVKNNLGIQVMSPMAYGILTGPHAAIAPLRPYGISLLEQAAIKFIIDHVPNGVPIPGTSKPDRVRTFLSVADMPPIPETVWQKVIHNIEQVPELMRLP